MNFLNDLCFLCLVPSQNIKSVLSQGDDNIVIEEKLKCVLSELVNFIPEIPKNICTDCLKGLNYVYKFKQKCLQNLVSLSDHLKTMAEDMSFEHFLSNSTEEQCENGQDKQNGAFKTRGTIELNENDDGEILKNGRIVAIKTYLDDEVDENKTEEQRAMKSPKLQYKCLECHKLFPSLRLLDRHILAHSPRFKCPTCLKVFKRPEHLKTHARIHTGERPYRCEVCCKTFTAQSNFISHKRIHNNQKPFKCKVCGKAFTQSSNLKIHVRRHH